MKKIISLVLVAIMALALAACGSDATSGATVDVADATTLLTNIWADYADDEKFPAAGGDLNNTMMENPGKFAVDAEEGMDFMLAVPDSAVSMVDDAASLVHMMNQNTFTCGAFHLADASNKQAFADAVKENLAARQWLCGQPDLYKIYAVGDSYIVSVFGASDLLATFDAKLTAEYGDAVTVLYEESLI